MRRTQEQRSEATRSAIVGAADKLFAARGFANTSVEDILGEAGLTRGALYHHFASKADIFLAVFESRESTLTQAIVEKASAARGSWSRFRTGCRAFLEACLDPSIQRIVLIDAWSVLGFDVIRRVESRHTLALLREGLAAAVRDGQAEVADVEAMANFLLGGLSQSAIAIARAKNGRAELTAALRELDRLLSAMTPGGAPDTK